MSRYLQRQMSRGVSDVVEIVYDMSPAERGTLVTQDPAAWPEWQAIFEEVQNKGIDDDAWIPNEWTATKAADQGKRSDGGLRRSRRVPNRVPNPPR